MNNQLYFQILNSFDLCFLRVHPTRRQFDPRHLFLRQWPLMLLSFNNYVHYIIISHVLQTAYNKDSFHGHTFLWSWKVIKITVFHYDWSANFKCFWRIKKNFSNTLNVCSPPRSVRFLWSEISQKLKFHVSWNDCWCYILPLCKTNNKF